MILAPVRIARTTALTLALALASQANAATPSIDPQFAGGHPATQPFVGMTGRASDVFIARNGTIVVPGGYVYGYSGGLTHIPQYRGVIARYLADGVLDATFGQQGIFESPPLRPSLQLRNGKFVAQAPHGLARFDASYAPDATMATDGAAALSWYGNANELTEQLDGKIVTAGSTGPGTEILTLARFNVDGTLDTTFNYVGAMLVDKGASARDVYLGSALQPDGKIVVAATSTVGGVQMLSILRFLADGRPDPSFGTGGRATLDNPDNTASVGGIALARQPSGRFVLFAVHRQDLPNSVYKFSLMMTGVGANGAIDTTFGVDGRILHDWSGASNSRVLVQPDGAMLFLTQNGQYDSPPNRPVLMRFTADGRRDVAFGSSGRWVPEEMSAADAMALQADGQLLLAGSDFAAGNFALARYSVGASPAIEYYNATLDHYFVTMNPAEAADLDAGAHAGWTRTNGVFHVYGAASAAQPGFVPVCRFYIPPAHGDSHFLTASADECAQVQGKVATDPNYSGYVLESPNAFYVALPDATSGACPSSTTPVYRLWNQRADSNHRYVADPLVKAQMIASGYVAEGYGPDAVAMCAPQ